MVFLTWWFNMPAPPLLPQTRQDLDFQRIENEKVESARPHCERGDGSRLADVCWVLLLLLSKLESHLILIHLIKHEGGPSLVLPGH